VDVSSLDEARRLIDELYDYVGVYKIGLELFTADGLKGLELFHQRGLRIMFDGKFLDIPNTVEKASANLAAHGVDMLTIHATGGSKMMAGAVQGASQGAEQAGKTIPITLAVTILTSISETMLKQELGVSYAPKEQVVRLGKLAKEAGVPGLVCSPEEVAELRTALGADMLLVTPGVRPSWASADDQSRIMTPSQALKSGVDYLVIGRPITKAPDRREAAKKVLAEMDEALAGAGR